MSSVAPYREPVFAPEQSDYTSDHSPRGIRFGSKENPAKKVPVSSQKTTTPLRDKYSKTFLPLLVLQQVAEICSCDDEFELTNLHLTDELMFLMIHL